MFSISNVRIGLKLTIMSGITILLVATLIGSQLMTGSQIKSATSNTDRRSQMALDAALANSAVRGMRIGVLIFKAAENEKTLDAGYNDYKAAYSDFLAHLDAIASATTIPARLEQFKKMKAEGETYAKVVSDLVASRREVLSIMAKSNGGALSAENKSRIAQLAERDDKGAKLAIPAALDIIKQTDEIAGATSKAADRSQAEVIEAANVATNVTIALGAVTIIVMVLTAIFGTVSIAWPMKALVSPLNAVAGGNFSITVPGVGRKDEVGQIAGAVAEMAAKVSSTIGEIKASGREVTNASAEISTSTTDLSQRTEEQAASLEQTSAAMEELSATVKKNSENAQLANTDANNTRDVADRGGKVVAKAVEAMAKIEDSSRKISDIIGVIDEIARQTNLLALNAAVEAARAGEAGRGFAVVASEVRSLAQRSSQAAKDIKDLITNSNGQVKDGVELVNKAGESLTEIVESIKKVASVVSDIANASIEQATGIDEINRALTQMDEVTQQNSALVEENAATAKTLEHQAKQMDEQVAFFQIAASNEAQEPGGAAAPHPNGPSKSYGKPAAKTKSGAKVAAKSAAPRPDETAQRSAAPARQMQTAVGQDWKEF